MKNINWLFLFFTAWLLTACTKDLPLPAIETQARIVVNSAFSADTPWQVQVSRSTSVTSTEQPSALTSAKVVLKDAAGNVVEELQHQQGGIFNSSNNTKPVVGQGYTIEVSADGFNAVDAAGNVPKPIDFLVTKATSSTFDGEQQFKIDFEINDDASSANYYVIESFIVPKRNGGNQKIPNELSFLDSNIDNSEIGDGTDRFNRIYLQDNTFNGQTYKTQATIYSFAADNISPDEYELFFVVKSVEESLYNYLKSFDRFRLAGEELFVEPVQVFTNVNNGLGIFSGFSKKEKLVEF